MTDAKPQRTPWVLHALLFLATCLTTTWAGAAYRDPAAASELTAGLWAHLIQGLPFSLSLLSILLTHEMGHYLLARRHRVEASLPYFLPLPIGLIGTLGAVIRMPRSIADRNALADIGAAGPLAGLAVAIPILVVGLILSPVEPFGEGLVEGNSLLYGLLKVLVKGQWLPGGGVDVVLHPVAWAGWVGLLVTMINLIPIGQLDGGHIAFAFFGNAHNAASRAMHRALVPLAIATTLYATWELGDKLPLLTALQVGMWAGFSWFVWWALLHLMRRSSAGAYHPPVSDQPLTAGRRRLCLAVFVVFVLIFTPIPLRFTL